jgi:hypothetical protein
MSGRVPLPPVEQPWMRESAMPPLHAALEPPEDLKRRLHLLFHHAPPSLKKAMAYLPDPLVRIQFFDHMTEYPTNLMFYFSLLYENCSLLCVRSISYT